jgi:hypothetical protein
MMDPRPSLTVDVTSYESRRCNYVEPETRCARPGEPYRNIERRCDHGFLDGKNCLVCDPKAREKRANDWAMRREAMHPLVVKRRVSKRREALLKISEGARFSHDLARSLGVSVGSASGTIRALAWAGYITILDGAALTDAGRAFMAGGAE